MQTRLRDSIRNMVNLLDRHSSATVEELNDNNGKNSAAAGDVAKEQSVAAAPKEDSQTES
ncbi:TPA: hypothetical protein RG501_RS12855 [Providencia rettgeri]|nr:hypothetical protein [Providencia rettgeri]